MACPYVVLNELGNAVDLYTPNLMLFSSDPSTKTPAKGDNMAEFKSGQYVVASLSGDWGGLEDAEEVIVRLEADGDDDLVIAGTRLVVSGDSKSDEIDIAQLSPYVIRRICSPDDEDEDEDEDEDDEDDENGEIKDETTQSELEEKVKSLEDSLAKAKDALAWMTTTKAKNYDSVEHGVYRAITAMQHSEDKIEASKRISDILKSSIKKRSR
jgi:hypothetical protein